MLKIIVSALLFIYISTVPVNASQTIHWGLGYEKPGEIPRGNASADYLKTYGAYFYDASPESAKTLYMTFDAGYENGYTEPILNCLRDNHVPATFFLVGSYLKKNPELIKRMVNEGHIIGNHTMTHDNMAYKSTEEFKAELKQMEELYTSVTGLSLKKYYRPPEGIFDEANLKTAHELGYKTILWSTTYADWDTKKQPSRKYAFDKLIPRLHPGAILLLHSTSATNAEILCDFIAECRKMGYEFKSLDNLK